jgi:hypothetical protein
VIRAAERAGLCGGVSANDRDRPLLTGVNGTLMARRTGVRPARMAVPWSSPVLLDSYRPSGRGRRVKAREATACGLALTRRTRPRQSSGEEEAAPIWELLGTGETSLTGCISRLEGVGHAAIHTRRDVCRA